MIEPRKGLKIVKSFLRQTALSDISFLVECHGETCVSTKGARGPKDFQYAYLAFTDQPLRRLRRQAILPLPHRVPHLTAPVR